MPHNLRCISKSQYKTLLCCLRSRVAIKGAQQASGFTQPTFSLSQALTKKPDKAELNILQIFFLFQSNKQKGIIFGIMNFFYVSVLLLLYYVSYDIHLKQSDGFFRTVELAKKCQLYFSNGHVQFHILNPFLQLSLTCPNIECISNLQSLLTRCLNCIFACRPCSLMVRHQNTPGGCRFKSCRGLAHVV